MPEEMLKAIRLKDEGFRPGAWKINSPIGDGGTELDVAARLKIPQQIACGSVEAVELRLISVVQTLSHV